MYFSKREEEILVISKLEINAVALRAKRAKEKKEICKKLLFLFLLLYSLILGSSF